MTGDYRIEKDWLGEKSIPAKALYGIHTARALENFPLARRPVNRYLVHAYGWVKLACAEVNHRMGRWDEPTWDAVQQACREMAQGELDTHIQVDALQGGAGTSTNMNINEVLTNRSLQILGHEPGTYDVLHPLEDLNRHQSTNDTYPTALTVGAIELLRRLERDVVVLLEAFQTKEKEFAHVVKVGRTQFQDAVLTTLGREMGAYADALARDRWRIYKCEERIRVVNLGGTAIGTGLGAPRQYIFQVVDALREHTGFGLARSENLVDATQNLDAFVEVGGILKALASNLFKIANDLRLMSSGPDAGFGEITLPARQAGSSIMPGKINPVIPEAIAQAALVVMNNDNLVTKSASLGSLELNAFVPLLADSLLGNLELLHGACRIFAKECVEGIQANEQRCKAQVDTSTAAVTALVEDIGYENAQKVASKARSDGISVRDAVVQLKLMTSEQFDEAVAPERVTRLGSPATPTG